MADTENILSEDKKIKELIDVAVEFEGLEEDSYYSNNFDVEVLTQIISFSISEYYAKFDKIFKKPDFQRNSVWNTRTKSRLIESFLKGYPVPPIMLYQLPKDEGYWIVDGWQRLSTISDFFNNKFALLLKENSTLHGKKFKNLTGDLEKYKNRLENNTFLSAIIIRAIEPKNDTFLYNVFERINTSSVALKAMEIRRAISAGKLIGLLDGLNNNPNWRKIFGQENPNTRFFDLELILRVLALYKNYNTKEFKLLNYQNMRQFLDDFTAQNKNTEFKDFENKFLKTCSRLVNMFESEQNSIFSLKDNKRMNYLVFDSIMTALLHAGSIADDVLKDRIIKYKNSEKAQALYSDLSGTTALAKVEQRLRIAYEAIINGK